VRSKHKEEVESASYLLLILQMTTGIRSGGVTPCGSLGLTALN